MKKVSFPVQMITRAIVFIYNAYMFSYIFNVTISETYNLPKLTFTDAGALIMLYHLLTSQSRPITHSMTVNTQSNKEES